MLKHFFIVLLFAVSAGCQQSSDPGSSNSDSGGGASGANGNIYTGENVNYIVTTNPGGGYDAYARLISKYLAKNLGADNILINSIF